jgi:stress response protein SCP2
MNAYIRLVNADNQYLKITRYDLAEDASTETAMIFGELYRHSGEWKFSCGRSGLCRRISRHVQVITVSISSFPEENCEPWLISLQKGQNVSLSKASAGSEEGAFWSGLGCSR